jgi:hypothetical protein
VMELIRKGKLTPEISQMYDEQEKIRAKEHLMKVCSTLPQIAEILKEFNASRVEGCYMLPINPTPGGTLLTRPYNSLFRCIPMGPPPEEDEDSDTINIKRMRKIGLEN